MSLKQRLIRSLQRRVHRALRAIGLAPESTFARVVYTTPRQVVLITTRHGLAENVWPVDWHVPLSFEPGLYGIALSRNGYGAHLLRDSGVFVVNFVPATWEKIILFCGNVSGRTVDKFEATGLRKEEAESVDAPRLADSLGALECRVQQTVDVGDHTLFIGEVTRSVIRADEPRLHHLDIRLRETTALGQETSGAPRVKLLD
jgi:flavin reductase (DIM6/NTAB) family NADH-FMN oxidoreductase RutF